MGDITWNEIIVFVHGVTTKGKQEPHRKLFLEFCDRINKAFLSSQQANKDIWSPTNTNNKIFVEWGWDNGDPNHTQSDKYLYKAEANVASAIWKNRDKGFWLIPMLIPTARDFFMYGVADMFYCVSEQGETTIKEVVLTQVMEGLKSQMSNKPDSQISLTCVGHSAGTVILHDLLFALFADKYRNAIETSSAFKALSSGSLSAASITKYQSYLKELRRMADEKKLRLRKFYTLGSPISPLVFRSNKVIYNFAEKKVDALTPEWIGIIPYHDLDDTKPRWVNFWHGIDVISYPLSNLYENSAGKIEDMQSKRWCFNPISAHGAYWDSDDVVQKIAGTY